MDYYVEAVSINRLEIFKTARFSGYALCSSALLFSYFWSSPASTDDSISLDGVEEPRSMEHAVTGAVIFSALLFMFGEFISMED